MEKESFAKELAALINRHSIDGKLNTNKWILADLLVDTLNAYGEANAMRDKMANLPEPDDDVCNYPACTLRRAIEDNPARVPKEVTEVMEFVRTFFPDAKIDLHRIDVSRKNPRDKRRGKNKRNEKGGNE